LLEGEESAGWKMRTGSAKFSFHNAAATALLTTISGYERCMSIVVITNSAGFAREVEALFSSVELKAPDQATVLQPVPGTNPVIEIPAGQSMEAGTKKEHTMKNGGPFAYTTTNFDDGWTSTVNEDWVLVTKGGQRVLIHYPNKAADAYNSVLLDGLKNAWNILVVPKYSSISNLAFRPVTSWEPIEFAEADAVERATGKTVYVVLFKKNFSGGSGKYIEFIAPDKTSFEQEFGPYHQTSSGWEKMEHMATYNRFAIGAGDLQGKWSSDFSSAIQYVNAYTGLNAGTDTHASAENFQFTGSTYKWDLAVANGPVGSIKFQSVKSNGNFSLLGPWQVKFSDIEGRPRIFNACFSAIKGLRILWLGDQAYGKVE
jgi:hypothetical protein